MKDTIKLFFALAFILGSFYLGKYQANENCNYKLDNWDNQFNNREKLLSEMRDSLLVLRKELLDCSKKRGDKSIKIKARN